MLKDAQVVLLCIFLLSPSAAPLPHAHLTHTQLSIPTPSHHTLFLPTPHPHTILHHSPLLTSSHHTPSLPTPHILHHSPLLTPSPYSITPHSSHPHHTPSLPTPHTILHHSPLLTPYSITPHSSHLHTSDLSSHQLYQSFLVTSCMHRNPVPTHTPHPHPYSPPPTHNPHPHPAVFGYGTSCCCVPTSSLRPSSSVGWCAPVPGCEGVLLSSVSSSSS